MTPPINIFELEEHARRTLPQAVFDYYASGAHDEVTLRQTRAAYDAIDIHYRVMVDAAHPQLATSVLGTRLSMPIAIAPTAFQRMAHADGELGTARAAQSSDTLMTLSTLSNTALEDVADVGHKRWYQLYVYKDRDATAELVARAVAAGYTALVLTVDAPYLGVRERDVRNQFALPQGLTVANLTQAQMERLPEVERESGLAAYFADLLEPRLTWDLLRWLVELSDIPVVVKGVVRPDDARRAVDFGAAGIVVSNHGARQLDTSPATIDVVQSVASAVGADVEVYMDGGIRRGTDVLKALARGARAVFVGRPVLWGLAYDGEAGVGFVLELLRQELSLAMSLAGAPTLEDLVGLLREDSR